MLVGDLLTQAQGPQVPALAVQRRTTSHGDRVFSINSEVDDGDHPTNPTNSWYFWFKLGNDVFFVLNSWFADGDPFNYALGPTNEVWIARRPLIAQQ